MTNPTPEEKELIRRIRKIRPLYGSCVHGRYCFCGDCKKKNDDALLAVIRAAVEAETERCAKVADGYAVKEHEDV